MVKEQIITIFNENKKRYGYRRITQELHNNDICVNHKTVQKLMKQLGVVCQVRAKRKYNSYKGEVGEVAPNLLERHFKTNQPNRKWVTDVTEFKVNDQKLYLSPILDLFNGEVVSYNLSRHPNFKQITDMLEALFRSCQLRLTIWFCIRIRLAVSDEILPKSAEGKGHYAKYVQKSYLSG